jgi:DNA-binding IclR family transcriptional regulator
VAVPVRNRDGEVVAATSVSVPVVRADEKFEERAAKVLAREAANLSTVLGYEEDGR